MKKTFIILLMAIIIIMPLNGAASTTKTSIETTSNQIKNVLNEGQTHTVLVESVSMSTCPYCPVASSQIYSIYSSGDYDFEYVTIVTDKISELPLIAQSHLSTRVLDELGVKSVPDVYLYGGYKNIKGRQDDEQSYRTAIEQSGSRSVTQVGIELNVEWTIGNIIRITAQVQSDDPEFDGNIRIYVTEINSRWNDQQGEQYHYAVLDIPVDKSIKKVSLDKSISQQTQTLDTISTITKWWSGDITKDNCMVIAAVFDKDTDYAIQTASAKPVDISNNDLSFNTNGYTNITVQEAFENYLSCYCMGVQIPIDIRRTKDEWNVEHIETWGDEQKPVNWPNLQDGQGLTEFLTEYAGKEVILYCRTGSRSWKATQLLITSGFTGKIYNMVGGITAWKEARYPTAISVDKAYDMLTKTSDGIQTPVDIRTTEEWEKEHIKTPEPENPVNYPDLHKEVGLDEFIAQYNNSEFILYCNTGTRSSEAVDLLIEKIVFDGFDGYVHNMIGGMNAWKDAGHPTPQLHSRFSLAQHTFLQKLLEIFPNSFPILRYLSGL